MKMCVHTRVHTHIKRPTTVDTHTSRQSCKEQAVSKETYYSVKRDLLQCQKRPTTVSKETYYSRYTHIRTVLQGASSDLRINDLDAV